MNMALISEALVGGVGLAVFQTNPRRLANQAFAMVSLVGGLWLAMVCLQKDAADIVPWMRANAMISPFLPWAISLLHSALARPKESRARIFLRSLPWLAAASIMVLLCFHDSFISSQLPNGRWARGTAYAIHSIILALSYLGIVILALSELRHQIGIRRLEIQLLVISLGVSCLLCLVFIALGNLFYNVTLKWAGLFIVFASHTAIGWLIAIQKIYDIPYISRVLGHYTLLVICILLVTWSLWRLINNGLSGVLSWQLSVTAGSLALFWLEPKSRKWFDINRGAQLARARSITIEIATNEPVTENLLSQFEILLRKECRASYVRILFEMGDIYAAGNNKLEKGSAAHTTACELGWTTPENLSRRRCNSGTADLLHFLKENSLGLMLSVQRGSKTPSLIILFGTKSNEWPYTYPEIERLQNISELMDNVLTRSRLTEQAALQARIEHLALMSRGVAHDLKNLITPISTFLVHMDDRFPASSPESEVHVAAKRSTRIMADYVREALFFSERHEPKFELVEMQRVFAGVHQATVERATSRGIALAVDPAANMQLVADRVLLQRLLANLVNNAIDASSAGQVISLTARANAGRVRCEVVDQGCGIPAENISRVFDPYFTTKEFGENVRGFGLGLTICQKIILLHRGKISVHSKPDQGTTFTIDLPVEQTSIQSPRPLDCVGHAQNNNGSA